MSEMYEATTAQERLWAEVMLQAIKDLGSRVPLIRHRAKYWIARKKNDGIGSFVWICDALGIEPDSARYNIFKTRGGGKK